MDENSCVENNSLQLPECEVYTVTQINGLLIRCGNSLQGNRARVGNWDSPPLFQNKPVRCLTRMVFIRKNMKINKNAYRETYRLQSHCH